MLSPGTQVGSYVVEALLGQGGMGAVFRARHVKLGSVHAVKVLLPQYASDVVVRHRFLNEGRLQAQLRHPHVVPVTDLLEADGFVGLVMEYVDGRTLDQLLRAPAPIDPRVARGLFAQVLAGVGHVHAAGVVHRDLKPSNVMVDVLDGKLRARILDFGIAKLEHADTGLTQAGIAVGTLRYMSPEQVQGLSVGKASDIFSLGIVLYELVTGRPPFDGDTLWRVQSAIVNAEYPPPESLRPDLSPALGAVIRKALAKRPEDRFTSCEAFSDALAAADRGFTPPVVTAEHRALPPKRAPAPVVDDDDEPIELPKPSRAPWVITAMVLVALGAGAWFLLSRPASSPPPVLADDAPAVRVDERSGLELVRHGGGPFRRGCDRKRDPACGKDDPAPVDVTVNPFWMTRTEVTVAAWERCVADGRCSTKPRVVVNNSGQRCNPALPDRKDHPVNCVTWDEARAFCDWLGGRLPRAHEWEFAAKGGGGRVYPWGDEPASTTHAHHLQKKAGVTTAPVGAHPAGASAFGLLDLAGNVWEWTADDVVPGESKEVRGGSWKSDATALRTTSRLAVEPETRSDTIGFRCAIRERSSGAAGGTPAR